MASISLPVTFVLSSDDWRVKIVPAGVMVDLLLLEWGGTTTFYVGCEVTPLLLPPGSGDLEALSVNSHFTLHLFKRLRNTVANSETDVPEFLLQYQMMQEVTAAVRTRVMCVLGRRIQKHHVGKPGLQLTAQDCSWWLLLVFLLRMWALKKHPYSWVAR